jgi:hypothetical protein
MTLAYVIVQEGEGVINEAGRRRQRGGQAWRPFPSSARTRARGSGHTNATHVNVSPGACVLAYGFGRWRTGGASPGQSQARAPLARYITAPAVRGGLAR